MELAALIVGIAVAFLVVGGGLGFVAGYYLATHIHSVASATTRATTLSSGDTAALNAKIPGLGTALQDALNKVGQQAVTALNTSAAPPAA